MYSNVLRRLPRNIASSAAVSFIFTVIDSYRFDYSVKQRTIKKDTRLDQNIQGILNELKVEKKPRITIPDDSEGILAVSIAIPLANKDKIAISVNEVASLYEKSDKKTSKRDLAKGILAHENVHNREYHSFFTRFGSSLTSMTSLDLAKAIPIRFLQNPIASIAIFVSTYILLHRYCEYRADKIAAQNSPLIRESLITSFDIVEREYENQRSFFSFHPKTSSRIERLKKLREEDNDNNSANSP
ncbi:MAG: M48 family metalloprotease [Legionellaceae bacterium]|nr:M48 family metalloprotease [Legionellaceae bacterium]